MNPVHDSWCFHLLAICSFWLTLTFESVLLPFLLKYRRTEKDSSWKDIYIITVAVIQSLHFWDKGLFTLTVSAFNWIQKWIVPFTLSCGCNNLYLFQTNVRWFLEMLSLFCCLWIFQDCFHSDHSLDLPNRKEIAGTDFCGADWPISKQWNLFRLQWTAYIWACSGWLRIHKQDLWNSLLESVLLKKSPRVLYVFRELWGLIPSHQPHTPATSLGFAEGCLGVS